MFTQQELTQVVEGMEVYDRDGNEIGKVDTFRLGEGTLKTTETDTVTIVETISDALGGHKELPTVLYARLYDKGFVRIKRGLFRSDMLIVPEQIDEVNAVSIHLNVDESELMKV